MSPTFPPIPKDAAKDFEGMVVIIGAGPSGLMAANALKFMGVENYIVLEASDRIGGRLKKTDDFHEEVPLDIGAEWIHQPNEQVVRDMLVYHEDTTLKGEGDEKDFMKDLEKSEFIHYSPEFFFRKSKARFLSWIYGETKWKRSTWWHWCDKYVYRHVQEKVKFNSPVKEIQYSTSGDDKVKIHTATGEVYTCDKVICTIPLGVLKQGSVKFDPPLPEKKLEAIEKVDFPPGFRVFFDMKENFYPDVTVDNNLIGQVFDGNDVLLVYDALVGKELSSGQNIVGYVGIGEKYAGELCKLSDDELAKAGLAKIDELFDGKGSKNYIKHIVQNWATEPYALGAYTFPASSKYISELGKTVGEKLFFAGEHTSIKHQQLVQGAAMEGRRAAVEAVLGHKI